MGEPVPGSVTFVWHSWRSLKRMFPLMAIPKRNLKIGARIPGLPILGGHPPTEPLELTQGV